MMRAFPTFIRMIADLFTGLQSPPEPREATRRQRTSDDQSGHHIRIDDSDGGNNGSTKAGTTVAESASDRAPLGTNRRTAATTLTLILSIALMITLSTGHPDVGPNSFRAAGANPVEPAIHYGAQTSSLAISRPMLAVVGASFAAGVGAGRPQRSWPYLLAQAEGWRVVVSADPGAGFLNLGAGRRGPFSRLARRLALARLQPQLIIVQGGYNDTGNSPRVEEAQVIELLKSLHRDSPRARLCVLSSFSPASGATRQELATDQEITVAARRAFPNAIILDPLVEKWVFPRIADHFHPSPAGHQWIASRLEQEFRRHYRIPGPGPVVTTPYSRPSAPSSGSPVTTARRPT